MLHGAHCAKTIGKGHQYAAVNETDGVEVLRSDLEIGDN